MFKKTASYRDICASEQLEVRERMETTLHKLQELKSRISELRVRCEELQRLRLEGNNNTLLCTECASPIEPGEEVEAKNFSKKAHYYHKECFKKLWAQCDFCVKNPAKAVHS